MLTGIARIPSHDQVQQQRALKGGTDNLQVTVDHRWHQEAGTSVQSVAASGSENSAATIGSVPVCPHAESVYNPGVGSVEQSVAATGSNKNDVASNATNLRPSTQVD